MARYWILAGHIICRGRPLDSFTVSRAANSIDPDQTESTLFAKIFLKCSNRRQNRQFFVISVFSALIFFYFQNVMLFSEKCTDPDEKSYYACGNSSRPSLFAKVPLLGESTKGKQKKLLIVVFHVDCKSGRKLRHIPNTRHSNVFVSAVNLTDLSPSGPARRFAEPDLGLHCLYDQSQTFAFLKCFQKQTINVLHAVAFFRILFCHHNQI